MKLSYKLRISVLDLDRREVARRLGLTYGQLSARLNGFTPWAAGEEVALVNLLRREEARREKGADGESN